MFENESESELSATFTFDGKVDLRPVWLGARTGMIDAPDEVSFNEDNGLVAAKDRDNEWYVVYGSSTSPNGQSLGAVGCDFERTGQGTNAGLKYSLKLSAGESSVLKFVIAGYDKSKEEALNRHSNVLKNIDGMIEQKGKHYQQINTTALLKTPSGQIDQAFQWNKYNTDWLINDVEGLGRGITA